MLVSAVPYEVVRGATKSPARNRLPATRSLGLIGKTALPALTGGRQVEAPDLAGLCRRRRMAVG